MRVYVYVMGVNTVSDKKNNIIDSEMRIYVNLFFFIGVERENLSASVCSYIRPLTKPSPLLGFPLLLFA